MANTTCTKVMPSDIKFSQDSMTGQFPGSLKYENVGKVLDTIFLGDVNLQKKILKNMKLGRVGAFRPPRQRFPSGVWHMPQCNACTHAYGTCLHVHVPVAPL